jgi:hypothetical protein
MQRSIPPDYNSKDVVLYAHTRNIFPSMDIKINIYICLNVYPGWHKACKLTELKNTWVVRYFLISHWALSSSSSSL